MNRITHGLLVASAFALVFAFASVNAAAIGTGVGYCGACWTYYGDGSWIGALFCSLGGC
jgi:hypothetical protein